MSKIFSIIRTDAFMRDVEEVYDWILESNFEIEQDVDLAVKRANVLLIQIDKLVNSLQGMPHIGAKKDSDIRSIPVHDGRYSVHWIVIETNLQIVLLSLVDNERPKELRYKVTDSGE